MSRTKSLAMSFRNMEFGGNTEAIRESVNVMTVMRYLKKLRKKI